MDFCTRVRLRRCHASYELLLPHSSASRLLLPDLMRSGDHRRPAALACIGVLPHDGGVSSIRQVAILQPHDARRVRCQPPDARSCGPCFKLSAWAGARRATDSARRRGNRMLSTKLEVTLVLLADRCRSRPKLTCGGRNKSLPHLAAQRFRARDALRTLAPGRLRCRYERLDP